MTLEADFDASPERVWQLWADPRQLERWWGPPTYAATVEAHDLSPGGRVEYHMAGPEGDQPRGFWDVDEVESPHRLAFRDGFANEDGTPSTELQRRPRIGHGDIKTVAKWISPRTRLRLWLAIESVRSANSQEASSSVQARPARASRGPPSASPL